MYTGRCDCALSAKSPAQPPQRFCRVTESVVVYHMPKRKSGLDLKGMVGEVLDQVDTYKGHELSATLPLKVQFAVPADGKDVKLIAHLVSCWPCLAACSSPFCAARHCSEPWSFACRPQERCRRLEEPSRVIQWTSPPLPHVNGAAHIA